MTTKDTVTTVILERQRFYVQQMIDIEVMRRARFEDDWKILEHEDACARRALCEFVGRSKRLRFDTPATWWEHLKATIRRRWPRTFSWVGRPKLKSVEFSAHAVVLELQPILGSKYTVIPVLDTSSVPDLFTEYEDQRR